eukprot:gene9260-1347_t
MPGTTELKVITKEQLSKHTEDDDEQWVVVEGRVIDITKYRYEHPGGADILLEHAGQEDCTEAFDNVGHGDGAKLTLHEYIIGILEGYENVEEKVLFVDTERKKKTASTKLEDKPVIEEGGFNVMMIVFPAVVAFFLYVYFKQ